MVNSRNIEELEINFAAFVNSARNVTFVLKKEFSKDSDFLAWYGNENNPKVGTKVFEMKNDELCMYFNKLRSEIIKEGINRINCSTTIFHFDTKSDIENQPPNSALSIRNKGIYFLIHKGTSKEDLIPAKTKAKITTVVFLENPPKKHLNKFIEQNTIFHVSEIYFNYLKKMVEEWTGIINSRNYDE